MKKITLLLALFLTFVTNSYAQCIRTTQYPAATVVSNNLGLSQSIATCSFTTEYAKLSGIVVGAEYVFTCKLLGVDKYITVTDLSDVVIAFGDSPLTVTGIPSSDIKVHFSNDDSCASSSSCHITTVQVILSCPIPLNASVSNITTTSADFTWEPGGSEVAWEVLILPTGSTAPTATTSGTAVSNNPIYSASSLLPGTNYQFYMRANCGSEFSPWSAPLNFATSCNAVSQFFQNFDAATTFPVCWGKVGTTGTANIQASTTSYSLPNNLNINSSSVTNQAVVVMPSVSNGSAGTHRLKFKARASTIGGVIEVGYLDDITNPASYVSLQSFTTTSTTVYDTFIAELGTDPSITEYLAFRNFGAPANSVLIDDVSWEPIPPCPDVLDITLNGTTSSTADISWSAGGSEVSWQYVIGASSVTDPSTLTPVGVNSNPNASISSLTDNTTYKVWVRSDCGAGAYGVWVGPLTFTTKCLPQTTLPWIENFDSLTAGTNVFPGCWDYANTTNTWSISTTPTAYSGANSLRRTWSTDGWAFTPLTTLNAGTSYTLSYFVRTNDDVVGYDITVGVGEGQTEGEMSNILSEVTGYEGPTWTKFSYEFTPTISGVYSYGIHVVAPNPPNGINFDDFKLAVSPTCLEPTELVSDLVTATTASIYWAESITAPANGYQYYVAANTVAPTATSTPTGTVGAGVITTDLVGLSPATSYCVWVRSLCSTSDISDWSTSTCFTTACAPVTIDYTQTFETTTYPANCWTLNNAGDVTTGPTGTGAGIWFADEFLNIGTVDNSIKVNLYNINRIGWIISPTFDLTGGNKKVSFDYAVTTWNLSTPIDMGSDDTVKLVMSEDEGVTWSEVVSFDVNSGVTNTSQTYTYDIPSSSATTKFAFLATDGTVDDTNDYDFFIDNFKVETTLGTSTFNDKSFAYYPNPVKNVLHLSYDKNITNVAVFNLLGQEVATKAINATQSQIDMSNLSKGTYLVKVTADNQVKTIKVIKE